MVKPNIGTAGRWARAICGLFFIGGAVAMGVSERPDSPTGRWISIGLLMLIGLFQLYEARKGWCIARACGLRTPL